MLADCYQKQGKLNEAIKLLQEVMEVEQETLGPQHEDYLKSKYQLADCYQKQGNFNEAIKLYKEIMEVQQETIGPQQKDYLNTKYWLSHIVIKIKENLTKRSNFTKKLWNFNTEQSDH